MERTCPFHPGWSGCVGVRDRGACDGPVIAIEAGHRDLFAGPARGSRLAIRDTPRIRFLTSDVAVVVTSGGGDRGSMITLTAVRQGKGWRFGSFQKLLHTLNP